MPADERTDPHAVYKFTALLLVPLAGLRAEELLLVEKGVPRAENRRGGKAAAHGDAGGARIAAGRRCRTRNTETKKGTFYFFGKAECPLF
jgi:hypothetical protein